MEKYIYYEPKKLCKISNVYARNILQVILRNILYFAARVKRITSARCCFRIAIQSLNLTSGLLFRA